MKKKQARKTTSKFKGVCCRRGKWYAQYAKANFRREFPSEMEAISHLMAVYIKSGFSSDRQIQRRHIANSPDKGRPDLESFSHIDELGRYRFPIDQKHFVILDEQSYIKYKGFWWFVRGNDIMGVTNCFIEETTPKRSFTFCYVLLDRLIWADKQAANKHVDLSDERPFFVNGNNFDLRWENLTSPLDFSGRAKG